MKLNKILTVTTMTLLPAFAFAQDGAAQNPQYGAYLAAGLCMGLAVALGTFSQSRAASSALEGMSRNPAAAGKLFVPMLLSLALMESLVLFAFLIAGDLIKK